MADIILAGFKKFYKIYRKPPGIISTLGSLFKRSYDTVKAVNGISFSIDRGELVGFIGPNGAGKTTTLKTLAGLLYPTEGQVSVLGFYPFSRNTKFLKQISFIMGQRNQLWWDLPSMDTFNLNKDIYEIDDHEYKKNLDYLVSLLEVRELLTIPVRQLSLGQRMKMELIASLLHKPRILFLDEPTIGLDVVMQKNIRDFVKSYNRDYRTTVLLTSHYMDDVKKLCNRVIIINKGKIIYDGNLEQLTRRYSLLKIISVSFRKIIKKENLKIKGEIYLKENDRMEIKIPANRANDIVLYLLNKFPVKDLTIEDLELEEIISTVFKEGL